MIGRIRNINRKKFNEFKQSRVYHSLKKITPLRKLKLKLGKVGWKIMPHNPKLHDDPILQRVFLMLVKESHASSIIETGTYLGSSSGFLARHFSDIPIYTSEINQVHFNKASVNLRNYRNVHQYMGTSPEFLDIIIKKKLPGSNPIFFLDAHWLDDWPLEQEMEIITRKIKSAIIMIDDFKVPQDSRWKYDKYGNKECSLELIKPHMSTKNTYNLLFPKYGENEIFSLDQAHYDLVGYPIIFQNMSEFFKKIKETDFVKRYFVDRSELLKFKAKKSKKS